MYRSFVILSIISTVITIVSLVGLYFQIPFIIDTSFFIYVSIYFFISFVLLLVYFFKDKKIILQKNVRFKNLLLYFFTTPIPLILFFFSGLHYKSFKSNTGVLRDISEFTIVKNKLKEGDPVEVIFGFGGPDYNNEVDFYYHYIVVSQTTFDTLNVLTTSPYYKTDKPLRNFYPANSDFAKLILYSRSIKSGMSINDLKSKVITKVVYNEKLKEEGNNHYLTEIGELGTDL